MNRVYIKPYMKWSHFLINTIVLPTQHIKKTLNTTTEHIGWTIKGAASNDLTA